MKATLRTVIRTVTGIIFVLAGTLHFVRPGFYVQVMPPWFAAPLLWVLLSGILEILGGVGLFLRRYRRPAAYGLALLMVAFLLVHLQMLFALASVGVQGLSAYLLFWRLALQFVLIAFFVWLAEAS